MLIPQAVVQPTNYWTTVTKLSDQSMNTQTTLQNDNELFFTTQAGALYDIEAWILYLSPVGGNTPDIKFGFGEDATARGNAVGLGFSNTDATVHLSVLCDQSATLVFGTATTNRSIYFKIEFLGNGGIFRVMWAQFNSNAQDVTVKAGSILQYHRIL